MNTILGKNVITGEPVIIAPDDRSRHLYAIGQTGVGKSVLLENLISQDLQSGIGVCFIDPHGQTAERIIELIPTRRRKQFIYLNPADLERPLGFNVLYNVLEDRKATVADDTVANMVGIFGASAIGPRSQQVLRNSLRALMDSEGTSLLCIPKLLTDKYYRSTIVEKTKDPFVRAYWVEQFEQYDARKRDDVISPILNKLDAFLSSPVIRNIVSQPVSTFDLRRTMDDGRILIVNLSKGAIGEENAHLLGALIITGIAQAALSRADTPEELRRPFHLYVDEFQNFSTTAFATILSEARKYALTLTIAHQYLAQIPEELRQAALGNVGSMLAFRVGAEDAQAMTRQLGWHNPDELQELPKHQAMGRFLSDGNLGNVTHLKTLPPPPAAHAKAHAYIADSARNFGRPRAQVERRIAAFLKA